jgi:hypothetical protein
VSARGLLDPWLPPVLLMALVFALSAQPNLDSGLGLIDLIGRKIVHAATYALLCLLWWRALRTVMGAGPAILAALLISVGYAVTDEYHQSFVEGRNGTVVDVVIDSLGAVAAALWLRRRHISPGAPAAGRAGAA